MEGLPQKSASTSKAPPEVPTALPREVQESSHTQAEVKESDQVAMDDEAHQELHAAIENGDSDVVMRLLQEHPEEQYFSYEDTSALFKAFSREKYDIVSFLIHKGAKIHGYEVNDLYGLEIDLTRVNHLLSVYNKKTEKSCVFQLISWSQSPQGLDGERLRAVMSMYEEFLKSKIIKLLMMVLESEAFDIVFDFSSDNVNRVHHIFDLGSEIFGLTLLDSKEIFIGSKNMLSDDPRKRAKVYELVAEELCHLALTTLFENRGKPYREEDSERQKEFWAIVRDVQSLADHSFNLEPVIKDVFVSYRHANWECELIARVPILLARYGEEMGRRALMETPELHRLITFYEEHVLVKCREYVDPNFNTKAHKEMKQLMKKNNLFSYREKEINPFDDNLPSFNDYLVEWENINVITTNCVKLSTLQVYHELKRVYMGRLERKCLFCTTESFKMDRKKIVNLLKCIHLDYVILVYQGKKPVLRRFKYEYLDKLQEFTTYGTRILLIIPACQSLGSVFEYRTVNFNWNDLTEGFKSIHEIIKYHLNGVEKELFLLRKDFQSIFSEEEIMMIINGNIFEVNDGRGLFSEGYIQETYIERNCQEMNVDKKIFVNLPDKVSIFISGMVRVCGIKSLGERYIPLIDEKQVQWLQGPEHEVILEKDKSIFIIDEGVVMDQSNFEKEEMRMKTFQKFKRINQWKTNIWLHHKHNEFYLKSSDTQDNFLKQHMKPIIRETEMLRLLKQKRTIIISDNAGSGKSTFISSLIRKLKESTDDSWIWRINMNTFLENDYYSLSLGSEGNSDAEEELNHLLYLIGLKNGLERYLLRKSIRRCFMFFDGLDEVPQEHEKIALKLISLLKEKTSVTIMITTRMHLQEELEDILSTSSFQLVHLSCDAQEKYLEKFWKWNLKYPCGKLDLTYQKNMKAVPLNIKKIIDELKKHTSTLQVDLRNRLENIKLDNSLNSMRFEIDTLNFQDMSYDIIRKYSLDKNISNFLGIPLHLYMIGTIYYHSNFTLEFKSEFFNLFSKFIEQKIQIYLQEKRGLSQDDVIANKIRKDAYRIHSILAQELLNKGTDYLASKIKVEHRMLCSYLGIVSIKDGIVHFLHRTFAEFFVAESLLQNMHEEVFENMFSNDTYIVVARFVLSALEERKIPEEFVKGVDFCVDIVKKIFRKTKHTLPSDISTLDTDMICLLKIVRKFLEKIEKTSKKGSKKRFIDKIHDLMTTIHKEHYYCQSIGVCLTSSMLKILLNKKFNKYLIALFSFVRYSKSHHEVLDVLEECTISETISKHLFQKRTTVGYSRAERLLKLSALKDSSENGLIYYALWNDSSDIFPNVLKKLKDVLGEKQFKEEIIQSSEYMKQLKEFWGNVHQNRFCTLFKELDHVFGNEVNILFDMDDEIKVRVTGIVVTSDNFTEMTPLLQKWFGDDKLKELLIRRDSDGNYSIHKLISLCSNTMFVNNLIEIQKVINVDEKFKELLQEVNKSKLNIFHLALGRLMDFEKLLQLCVNLLENQEILNMLLNFNKYGNNVLHSLICKFSFEELREYLNLIMKQLGVESFQKLLKSKNRDDRNIFQLSILMDRSPDEMLNFSENHLKKPEITEMLLSADKDEYNVMHYIILYMDSKILQKNLGLFKTYLGDDVRFKNELKSETKHSGTILHLAVKKDNELDISFLRSYLDQNEIADILKVRKNKDGRTCLHDAAYFDRNVSELLDLANFCLKDEFEDFIMGKDNCGNTFLHLICHDHLNQATVMSSIAKHFDLLRKILFGNIFDKLLKVRNNKGQAFIQTDHKFRIEMNQYFERILGENIYRELSRKVVTSRQNDDACDSLE